MWRRQRNGKEERKKGRKRIRLRIGIGWKDTQKKISGGKKKCEEEKERVTKIKK